MIVDTSAIIAVLMNEPERERFLDRMLEAAQCAIAAPTLLETSIVLTTFGPLVASGLAEFIQTLEMTIIPFDEQHLAAAQDANRRFGKRSGHPARLNFGDCFTYAACALSGQPLLFKGADFAQTDLLNALTEKAC